MIKDYYQLTKPGIIYGNAITAAAGFFLASKGQIDIVLLIMMLLGLSLIIGGACVLNNVFDIDIDGRMERTKNRALVRGVISKRSSIIFGVVLLVFGILVFLLNTYHLALITALVGSFVYLVLYTPLKRKTVFSTAIGSISGATPPVVGYTAVTGKFDLGALILLLILATWQMAHFYSIGIYRLQDYMSAGLPVLPVKKGTRFTKINILFFILLFIAAASLLTVVHYTGYVYFSMAVLLGLYWFFYGVRGLKVLDDVTWAKRMFRISLLVLTLLCIAMSIDVII